MGIMKEVKFDLERSYYIRYFPTHH